MTAARIDGYLVTGGLGHDFDFARLELLKALAVHEHVRTIATPDYERLDRLDRAAFVVSYTCDVEPSAPAQAALADFVARGGRWFALHATNSLLSFGPEGVGRRAGADVFLDLLGAQFAAHPPIGPFLVENCNPAHPLTAGLEAFTVEDELYLMRMRADVEVLLATRYRGPAPGFVDQDWSDDDVRPILYLRRWGQGAALYCTLGHARGHYDAQHRTPYFPVVERGAWATGPFREILRRGVRWMLSRESADG